MSVRTGMFWALISQATWGCSDPDGDPSAELVVCRAACNADLRCGFDDSFTDCVEFCREDWWAASHLTVAAARVLAPCIEQMACENLYAGDDPTDPAADKAASIVAWGQCFDAAENEVEPTRELRELCTEFSPAEFECAAWISIERCEETFGIWRESVREEVRACLDATECDELDECIDIAIGGS